ncbi:MAG: ABC transporter [Planctomycetota bacterium]|nr:MAG: ABC transporter [Planctomycetota bacterium]
MTTYDLELEGVTKRFGDFVAVKSISLKVPKGAIYGFLGPNGSGKTTTMRMIMSIFYPDEGRISVLGHPNAEAVKDRLGYLPEEKGLYKKMKVEDIIAYFGSLKGMPSREAKEKSKALLHKYGLGEWIGQKTEAMSKGMGQKIQLLGTIVHDPDLVILDEPFSGLDPINMELMRETILDIKRSGKTVLFSTHVMAQAEDICDSILLMYKGDKVLDGSMREVRAGGPRAIVVEYEGEEAAVRGFVGIERINDAGKRAEVYLEEGVDSQDYLKHLIDEGVRIVRFDLREPSLHEVFVRTVGAQAEAELTQELRR